MTGAGLKRRKRLAPKRRSAADYARIYGSRRRVQWIKAMPCAACGHISADGNHNHHTENGGMGRKAGYATIVPLCPYHHEASNLARLDHAALRRTAAAIERLWQRTEGA